MLTELRQGQVVGEVALVDQGVRSATIRVSRDDTLLLRLRREVRILEEEKEILRKAALFFALM